MPKPEMIPSEPYVPDVSDDDRDEIVNATGIAPRKPFVEGNKGSLDPKPVVISPQRRAYQQRLDAIMDLMAQGQELSNADAEFAVNCGLLLVLRESRRASHHLKAVDLLQHAVEKKLLARTIPAEGVVKKGPTLSIPT
jgi:hypothetical protein